MSLKIYPVVLELVRRLSPLVRVLRARSSVLADQMERALISMPLNVAEGAYSRGKNRQVRFQSAAGSARETLACLETAEAMGRARARFRTRCRALGGRCRAWPKPVTRILRERALTAVGG
jgi:four helix bundle protein